MTQKEMEVKRGMVFYMDVPSKEQPVPLPNEYAIQKKRPYIVLAGREQCEHGYLIHVAPITTKPPLNPVWWKVPFKVTDGSCRWIIVSNLMLVPKKFCNVADYSEALSNVCVGNKDIDERVNDALLKLLGIENKPTTIIKEETKMETNFETTNKPEVKVESTVPNMLIPNINITINFPGIGTITPEIKVETPTQKTDVEKPETENIKTTKTNRKNYRQNYSKGIQGRTTISTNERISIAEFIRKNYKRFGGEMTLNQCAAELGIAYITACRYATKLYNGDFTFHR